MAVSVRGRVAAYDDRNPIAYKSACRSPRQAQPARRAAAAAGDRNQAPLLVGELLAAGAKVENRDSRLVQRGRDRPEGRHLHRRQPPAGIRAAVRVGGARAA
ncbi:hypothetical protein NB693_25580 [Pantoea ananatis]|uniref:hypothetical protein n=1 Tax=Pantoea ananas TaxID=553 RepID=UPI002220E5AA|nr:hypothetical protein [Pantoea ananatis]